MPGVDGDPSTLEARREPPEGLSLAHLGPSGPRALRPKATQGFNGGASDDAVRGEADIALKLPQRAIGPDTENAVLLSGVEPQEVEPGLEGSHVVAPKVRIAEVEDPVLQAVSGLDQLVPRLFVDLAVHQELASLLEAPHRLLGTGPEEAVFVGIDLVPKGRQSRLQVPDRTASRASLQDCHGSHCAAGELLRRRCAAGSLSGWRPCLGLRPHGPVRGPP